MIRAVAVAAMVVGLGASGCGTSSDHVAPAAASALQRDVDALRATLANGDRAGADHSLGNLDRDLARLRAQGQISAAAAARVQAASEQVHRQLRQLPPPSTTSTTTTVAPPAKSGDQGDGGD